MTTLKQHQAAMVNLLANSTAIPTSAVRLAHALHDVLAYINGAENAPEAHTERRIDATTSGLNDAALASDIAVVKPKRSSAEQQIAMLNNTIRQLRESNAKLRKENGELEKHVDLIRSGWVELEQAGCRKEDTQVADGWIAWAGGHRDEWPVAGETFVDVKMRNGRICHGFCAQVHHWDHRALESDIIAYRIAGAK